MAENENNDKKEEKIEVCYTCGKEFDMNSDEGAQKFATPVERNLT